MNRVRVLTRPVNVIVPLGLAALLGACAHGPAEVGAGAQAQAPAPTQVCTREIPLGSTIPVTRCRSRDEIASDRAAAEAARASIGAGVTQPQPDRIGR